jgi:hypothetical protein
MVGRFRNIYENNEDITENKDMFKVCIENYGLGGSESGI